MIKLLEGMAAYIDLYREMFGDQEDSGLMQKPNNQVLDRIGRLTITEFLKKEKLEAVIPIFQLLLSAKGFG